MTLSGREVLGFAVQTEVGTPVDPTLSFIPEPGTFRATTISERLLDRGRRGRDSMDFRSVEGVGRTELTWQGLVREGNATQKAEIGFLIDNLLGASSTAIQIVATGNYDHRLILGTTKEYLTIEQTLLRDSNDRQFEACRVSEIVISYNAGEGSVGYTVTLEGRKETLVTAQTITDPAQDAHRGWQAQAVIAGSANTRLISAEFTLRRAAERHFGSNDSQDFADLYLGPLEATVSMVFDYTVPTDLDAFKAVTQAEVSVLFRTGTLDTASERTFGIGGVVCDLGDGPAELDNSNPNVRLGLTGRFLDSSSNGPFTSNGNAATAQNGPVQIQIVQLNATPY